MGKHCAECGKKLEGTGSGPEWMNPYQWDACKAGDYFAKCENATHPNGNCYFWKSDKDNETFTPDRRATLSKGSA